MDATAIKLFKRYHDICVLAINSWAANKARLREGHSSLAESLQRSGYDYFDRPIGGFGDDDGAGNDVEMGVENEESERLGEQDVIDIIEGVDGLEDVDDIVDVGNENKSDVIVEVAVRDKGKVAVCEEDEGICGEEEDERQSKSEAIAEAAVRDKGKVVLCEEDEGICGEEEDEKQRKSESHSGFDNEEDNTSDDRSYMAKTGSSNTKESVEDNFEVNEVVEDVEVNEDAKEIGLEDEVGNP